MIPEKAQEKVKEAKVVAIGDGSRNKVGCSLNYLPIALDFCDPVMMTSQVCGFGCGRKESWFQCRLPWETRFWCQSTAGPNSSLTMR